MAKENKKSRPRSGSNTDRSSEILTSSGHVPKVPVSRSKWLDTTIHNDFFWRDVKKRDLCAHSPADGGLRFIQPEPRVNDRRNIDENSILRFRNERKELPLSETVFGYAKQMLQGWQSWVYYIVNNSNYRSLLESAGINYAILIFSDMVIRSQSTEIWRAILARWSTHTHTFVTSWGEITPTLEDVCALLSFPYSGLTDITTADLSEEDEGLIEMLEAERQEAKDSRRQASFCAWIRHFFEHERTHVEGPRRGCE